MNILALDTSSKSGSAAYMEKGVLLGEVYFNTGNTHSETALPQIDLLLKNAHRQLGDVELIATTTGPGSFTGLRIGISTVKGLAFGRDLKVFPVSSLQALSMNFPFPEVPIVGVMDARRNQVYTGIYRHTKGETETLLKDQILLVPDLIEILLGTPQGNEGILVGDGSSLVYSQLQEFFPKLQQAPPHLLHQRASSLCTLAFLESEKILPNFISPAQLEPVYLRIPQAERERLEKEKEDVDDESLQAYPHLS